jgi:hypothetical protein
MAYPSCDSLTPDGENPFGISLAPLQFSANLSANDMQMVDTYPKAVPNKTVPSPSHSAARTRGISLHQLNRQDIVHGCTHAARPYALDKAMRCHPSHSFDGLTN